MFTFDLNQIIYYILDNRIHSAKVLARMQVDNAHEDWVCNDVQKELYTPFGPGGVFYSTCHGIISNRQAFGSRQDLVDSLIVA